MAEHTAEKYLLNAEIQASAAVSADTSAFNRVVALDCLKNLPVMKPEMPKDVTEEKFVVASKLYNILSHWTMSGSGEIFTWCALVHALGLKQEKLTNELVHELLGDTKAHFITSDAPYLEQIVTKQVCGVMTQQLGYMRGFLAALAQSATETEVKEAAERVVADYGLLIATANKRRRTMVSAGN